VDHIAVLQVLAGRRYFSIIYPGSGCGSLVTYKILAIGLPNQASMHALDGGILDRHCRVGGVAPQDGVNPDERDVLI
jgi:hypothetical protein